MTAPRPLVYTALDFDAILAELAATSAAQPELAGLDLSPGSPDARFNVAVATLAAKLAYYQNRWVNEAFLTRARLRQSVVDHAAGLGYTLATPSPAKTTEALTLPRAYSDALTIPAGSVVQTEDGAVSYTTDGAVTFAAGTTAKTVGVTEGAAWSETAVGEASSTSPTGQRVSLPNAPFVGASEVVKVDGVTWTRVRNFLSSTSASNHYRIEVDGEGAATVVFGDDTNGRRPPEGSDVLITYRTCSGTAGRVRRGRLTRILGSFYTEGGVPVEPTCTNPSDATGGTDRETLEHARYAAPESLRATTRTVAREDFELHATEVTGVARALCHTRIEDNTLPYNFHRVYVVPTGGGTPSASLCTAVETYVTATKPCEAGVVVEVVTAIYAPQTVNAVITVRKGTDTSTLEADGQDAVERLFDPEARDADGNHLARFGYCVPRSSIDAALAALPGVTKVTLSSPSSDPTLTAREFPSLAATPGITILTESA